MQPDDDAPVLVSRSDRWHLSQGECLALAVAAASVLALAWGLVQLARGVLDDGVGLSLGGAVFALGAVAVVVRRPSRQELQVRPAGLVRVRRGGTEGWRWEQVHDAYVIGSIDRVLVLETDAARAAQQRSPRATGLTRSLGAAPPLAVQVPLRGMVPDERQVLNAIETVTGGRLPSPERGLGLGRPRS
ncbi:hypothetical protein [Nocardioides litoris]|uniref:hypothetical protein n=1 Tax=Nocardioides litoris TaxID=1926648 RepID=UPI00111D563D|nr:hypothetical protein [Nocardioides litoris]